MTRKYVPLASLVIDKGLQTGPFGSQLKAEEYTETGIPVVMPKDISHGDVKEKTIARIPKLKVEKLVKHKIKAGDIIFPRRGDLGRIAVANSKNEGWICGTGCLRARLIKSANYRYIHQYVQLPQVKKWLERNALGQTMLNLNTGIIGELPIYMVSMEEQVKIAEILERWDASIIITEQLIEKNEKRISKYINLLVDKQCNEWSHIKTRDLFESVSIKNKPDEELLSVTQNNGVVPRNMLEGRVMSPSGSTAGYKLVEAGDFVISLRSFQGGVEYSEYCGIVSPAYTVLKNKQPICHEFYQHFFKSHLFIEKYLRVAVIGIRDGRQVSYPDFESVKLPYPPMEQQEKTAKVLTTAKREIELLKQQLALYKKQKRGLMQKLLTGEWRVKTDKAVA